MTRLQFSPKNGQFTITIPKNIALALQLRAGMEFNIQLAKNGNIELVRLQEVNQAPRNIDGLEPSPSLRGEARE